MQAWRRGPVHRVQAALRICRAQGQQVAGCRDWPSCKVCRCGTARTRAGAQHVSFKTLQGLAFPEIAVGGARPPFQNALDQGLVSEPVFSFWLNRNSPSGPGGELTLGGVDPDHYRGKHTWCAPDHTRRAHRCWACGLSAPLFVYGGFVTPYRRRTSRSWRCHAAGPCAGRALAKVRLAGCCCIASLEHACALPMQRPAPEWRRRHGDGLPYPQVLSRPFQRRALGVCWRRVSARGAAQGAA